MDHSSKYLIAIVAMIVFPVLSQAEDISRTFQVSPGGRLAIDVDVGTIDVVTTAGDTVTVDIEVRGPDADRFEVDFRQTDGGVKVKGRLQAGGMWGRRSGSVGVKVRAGIPQRYNLDLETAGGAIDVGDLDGSVRADTAGGSIVVGVVTGPVRADTSGGVIEIGGSDQDVDADTSGGSIKLGTMNGRTSASTSGGSIRVERTNGPLRASTSGGSISIRAAAAAVDASTSGGSVKATFIEQPDDDSELSTSGGRVTVRLAEGLRFDLRARSGVGVDCELPVEDAEREPGRLAGRINGGGPRLDLRSSGRVRVERL